MRQGILFNILSLILLVSLFLFTPFDGFKKLIILGTLTLVWMISSYAINRKAMGQTIPLFIMLFFLLILQWIYSEFPGEEDQFRRFFTQNIWTYIWGVLGVFYASNINAFKKSIPFIVIMISVSCIYTIIGNIAIPGASRMLAGSAIEGSQIYSLIHSMNIGGYGFIYALVFAVVPCTLWIKYRLNKIVLSSLFLVLILSTLLVGSYFTSIILAIFAMVLSLSNTRKISTSVIVSSFLILLVIAFGNTILQGLVDFGALIDSPMLQTRAQQMLDGTYQEAYESAGDYSRWDRIVNAIHNIGQSPILGRMTSKHLDILPSGHSELLGYFERYGIFGLMHILYFYTIYKKIHKCASTKEMKLLITVFFSLFFLFITLDTFDIANSTGCMVFLIAPCTMLYIESRISNYKIGGNNLKATLHA